MSKALEWISGVRQSFNQDDSCPTTYRFVDWSVAGPGNVSLLVCYCGKDMKRKRIRQRRGEHAEAKCFQGKNDNALVLLDASRELFGELACKTVAEKAVLSVGSKWRALPIRKQFQEKCHLSPPVYE
jgi:hypothetical protein